MEVGTLGLVAIIFGSIIPPLIYVLWMQRAEKYGRKRLIDLIKAFIAGAALSTVGGILLSLALLVPLVILIAFLSNGDITSISLDSGAIVFITAVVIAPFAEELVKAGTVILFRRRLTQMESGIIYGAAVGLGFAAVENILYGMDASGDGLETALFVIGIRSVTAAFGHASYTAVSGYGIARWHRSLKKVSWLPFYLLAVALHAFSNLIASMGEIFQISETFQILSIVLIFGMDLTIILLLRKRVKQIDQAEMELSHPPPQAPQAQQLNQTGNNGSP
jgi:RsiW-degrading membrane proteinase PrsW (M82 family)